VDQWSWIYEYIVLAEFTIEDFDMDGSCASNLVSPPAVFSCIFLDEVHVITSI
jgi:hypothetical protein